MENFVLDARQHLDTADALKPYEECPERAAIEATIALTYAVLAVVERLDALVDEIGHPIDSQGFLRVNVQNI